MTNDEIRKVSTDVVLAKAEDDTKEIQRLLSAYAAGELEQIIDGLAGLYAIRLTKNHHLEELLGAYFETFIAEAGPGQALAATVALSMLKDALY